MKVGKKLGCLLLVVALLCSVVACAKAEPNGSDEQPQTTVSPTENTENNSQTVNLSALIWYQDEGRKAIYDGYLKKYQEKFPNVEIEFELCSSQDEWTSKISTYSAADELPDIIYSCTPDAYNMIKANQLVDLLPYIQDDGFIDKYTTTSSIEPFSSTGGVYFLNGGQDYYFGPALFYHPEMFKQNGVTVPTTWDELVSACAALKSSGVTPISVAGDNSFAYFLSEAVFQAVDPTLLNDIMSGERDWSDPAVLESVDYLKQMVDDGFFRDDAAVVDYSTAITDFGEGRAAMQFAGTWEISTLKGMTDDIDMMDFVTINPEYPQGYAAQYWGSRQGGYGVAAKENIDEAVKVAEYFATCDAIYYSTECGYPVLIDTGVDYDLDDLMAKNVERLDSATVVTPTITSSNMSGECANEYALALNEILAGTLDPAGFVQRMDDVWKDNFDAIVY